MSSKTKIVVFKMKELIYTAVFVGLGILLVILLVYMFFPNKVPKTASVTSILGITDTETVSSTYVPGVYTASMVLNGQNIDIAVTVDADHINSVNLINLNDTITTMFPLVEPALEELTAQICHNQSLQGVTYSDDAKFTSEALLKTISSALKKATPAEE